jgi:predicted metal-dependent hydrolase
MRQTRGLASSTLKAHSIDDIGAPVEVRRHPGARRLTLRVSRARRAVIVTLPVQCDLDEAGSFLHRNIAWVRERLDSLPAAVPFRHGVLIPLRGETHRILFRACEGGRPPSGGLRKSSRELGSRLEQSTDSAPRGVVRRRFAADLMELCVTGAAEHAPRRLRDWLAAEAGRDLDASVARHASRLGLSPKRIAVRDQSSRWGSCSTTGVLSFSWRLILAPPRILDYVAAHEVAHLKEMNHGARFWSLVRQAVPDMDEAKQWLQIFGMDLHRYGTLETVRGR